jgi:hypothetical protein
MTRFLVIGLPRSGTTYVQTLLSSHRDILCRGEMFVPGQIDDSGTKSRQPGAVAARDADPAGFLARALRGDGLDVPKPAAIGIKVLFHHHPRLFAEIVPADPALRLIHVTRENRLAQFASARQVQMTGDWVAGPGRPRAPRVRAGPFWAAGQCNRLENEDFLLGQWIAGLPNPSVTVRYREMASPGTATRLARFLDVEPDSGMASPLRKQGQNRVLDRFANPEPIARHFRAIGRGDWLGPELPPD